MYEPRIGDLVTAEVGLNGNTATVFHVEETGLVLVRSGAGYKYALEQKVITPLRPDAPGQRVRCMCGCGESGLVLAVLAARDGEHEA